MNSHSTIIELDADHLLWNNELNDMKDEISEFEVLLGRIENTNKNIEKEHFQNQFSIHKNAIEEIKNHIQKCQIHSNTIQADCFDVVTEQKSSYHQSIAKMLERQVEMYNDIKVEFQQFNKS